MNVTLRCAPVSPHGVCVELPPGVVDGDVCTLDQTVEKIEPDPRLFGGTMHAELLLDGVVFAQSAGRWIDRKNVRFVFSGRASWSGRHIEIRYFITHPSGTRRAVTYHEPSSCNV